MPKINIPKKKSYTDKKRTDKRNIVNNVYVYNTRTWRNLRLQYLSEHPLCERCLPNKIVSAVDVHHVIPISSTDDIQEKKTLGFDIKNLEALCKECHKEEHFGI